MSKALRALPLAAFAALSFASAASAAEVVITNIDSPSPLPAGTNWSTIPTENTGTAEITTAAPRSGNGSIELTGDRTRVQTGYQYGNAAGGVSNMGLLDNVAGLAFDWQIAADSVRAGDPNYTPALRLLVQNGTQRSELIWEGAYNGVGAGAGQTPATPGAWASTGFNDLFWQFVAGVGPSEPGGALALMTITDWATQYGDGAFVSGISVGAGSTAGVGYHAFADNVRFSIGGVETTYNFEAAAPVPEPATWAFMIVGFGAVGYSLRSQRRKQTALAA